MLCADITLVRAIFTSNLPIAHSTKTTASPGWLCARFPPISAKRCSGAPRLRGRTTGFDCRGKPLIGERVESGYLPSGKGFFPMRGKIFSCILGWKRPIPQGF